MKDMSYIAYFDVYAPLLTEVQKEIFEAYYGYDLSLAEIAAERGTTRQSVMDTLTKTRRELDELETRLGFSEKNERIKAFALTLPDPDRDKLLDILEK